MKNLLMRDILKEFINNQQDISRLPVKPSKQETPIIPSSRWNVVDGGLVKRYTFRDVLLRDRFICDLLAYERQINHHAAMMICATSVTIRVATEQINTVTELDKEYASYCDVLFKDICS